MPTIDVDEETAARLQFAAKMARLGVGDIVRNLVEESLGGESPSGDSAVQRPAGERFSPAPTGSTSGESKAQAPSPVSAPVSEIPAPAPSALSRAPESIYASYLNVTTRAEYNWLTGSVTIQSGVLAGHTYESLTASAVAVVGELNPERKNPETNGRIFWHLASNGEDMRSVLGKR